MCCHCPIVCQLPVPNCCPTYRFAKFILDHQTEYLRVKILCKQQCLGKHYTNLWTRTNCNIFGPKKLKENLHCIIPVSLWNFLLFPTQIFPKRYNYSPMEPGEKYWKPILFLCPSLTIFPLSSFFIWMGITFLLIISFPWQSRFWLDYFTDVEIGSCPGGIWFFISSLGFPVLFAVPSSRTPHCNWTIALLS